MCLLIYMCVCAHVQMCIYVCMYVCMHIYIYVCTCMYMYTPKVMSDRDLRGCADVKVGGVIVNCGGGTTGLERTVKTGSDFERCDCKV